MSDIAFAPVQAARVRAGLIGLALGDALGVPHEFPRVNRAPYTGELYVRTKHASRFQGVRVLATGQVSDDTELTLALARALVDGDGHWCPSHVAGWYLKWANSKTPLMGATTRELFKGVRTVGGYAKRYAKRYDQTPVEAHASAAAGACAAGSAAEAAQSNGSLMRCFALACVVHRNPAAPGLDAALSNPSSVNVAANTFFVQLVRLALEGQSPAAVWTAAQKRSLLHPMIETTMKAVEANEPRTLADDAGRKTKGWVLNALFAALHCLRTMATSLECEPAPTFATLMHWVIHDHPGSDTDTNAAIAGMLIGSLLGWDALHAQQSANIGILLGPQETDIPRPPEFKLDDVETLCERLARFSRELP